MSASPQTIYIESSRAKLTLCRKSIEKFDKMHFLFSSPSDCSRIDILSDRTFTRDGCRSGLSPTTKSATDSGPIGLIGCTVFRTHKNSVMQSKGQHKSSYESTTLFGKRGMHKPSEVGRHYMWVG